MDHEKILDRVRKLLAMSKDASSPYEAAIAAGRARKLIDQYQLSELELNRVRDDQLGTSDYTSTQKTRSSMLGMLAVGCADLNDCQVIYKRNRFTGGYDIVFQGMLVDTVSSVEMLKYLRETAYKLSEVNARGRANRHAYRMGFVNGIRRQVNNILEERAKLKSSNGTSLVVMKTALVEGKFGKVSYSRKKSSFAGDGGAWGKGREDGLATSLNRQVGEERNRLESM